MSVSRSSPFVCVSVRSLEIFYAPSVTHLCLLVLICLYVEVLGHVTVMSCSKAPLVHNIFVEIPPYNSDGVSKDGAIMLVGGSNMP